MIGNVMKKTRIACLGDSITRGTVSYPWVKELNREMRNHEFKNFGKNGDLAFNALQRLDGIVEFDPDHIIILLGTNDVNAVMNPANTRRYTRSKRLPAIPCKQWYAQKLEEIVILLSISTKAQIALCTLPVLGEDLMGPANQKVREYNREILRIARDQDLPVLDLYVRLASTLVHNTIDRPVPYQQNLWMMAKAALRRLVLRQDWEKISAANGLYVTTDTIHLNATGGKILASLVRGYLGRRAEL